MSGSGEKEEVKLPWEVAVEAFGRSVPGGRHSASRGGSSSGQHCVMDTPAARVRLGAPAVLSQEDKLVLLDQRWR